MIGAPRLYSAAFMRESDDEIPAAAEGKIDFKLRLARLEFLKLGVEFGVSIEEVQGLVASVLFRMTLTLEEESPEAADPETAFRQAAARLAPTVMYPYVREALSSLATKAQIPNFVLPIINFGEIYSADEISVPEVIEQAQLSLND
jgi:hypothetical protein